MAGLMNVSDVLEKFRRIDTRATSRKILLLAILNVVVVVRE